MNDNTWVTIALFILSGIFTILWYLLRQKDETQARQLVALDSQHRLDMANKQEQIDLLFEKHDMDVEKLVLLDKVIAKNYYERKELDDRFIRLESTIKDGFKDLGVEIKEMTKAFRDGLKEHIQESHNKQQ